MKVVSLRDFDSSEEQYVAMKGILLLSFFIIDCDIVVLVLDVLFCNDLQTDYE